MAEPTSIQKSTTETLRDWLQARRDAINQLVPKHLTADRLMRVAVNCVAKTPDLQRCSPTSLLQSVLVAAELGLEPGGALGHLYLVPFGNICTPIVGYRGLIELARRTGEVSSVRAVVVRERDKFKLVEGINQSVEHEPYLDGDPGPMKHVYCVVLLKDGGQYVELMTKHQVDAIRGRSKSANKGPWVNDYEEMARKTVARRALKWCPLSSERLIRAYETDDADMVEGEVLDSALETESLKDRVAKKTGRLLHAPTELESSPQAEEQAPTPDTK